MSGPCSDSSCPLCSCPSGKVKGDIWHHEYQRFWDIDKGQVRCIECECKEDPDGLLYTECNRFKEDLYRIGSSSTCPPGDIDTISCHEDNSNSRMFYVQEQKHKT